MNQRNATKHRMGRRSPVNDYCPLGKDGAETERVRSNSTVENVPV